MHGGKTLGSLRRMPVQCEAEELGDRHPSDAAIEPCCRHEFLGFLVWPMTLSLGMGAPAVLPL